MPPGKTFPMYTSSTASFSTSALFSVSSMAKAPSRGAGSDANDLEKVYESSFQVCHQNCQSITYPLKLPMGVLAPDTKTTSFKHLFDEVDSVLNEILLNVAMFVQMYQ